MNNQIQWEAPFDDRFGNEMVYRLFSVEDKLFGVGFQELLNMHELTSKGIDILSVKTDFVFPATGMWAVVFDEIDPVTMSFKGFRHVDHRGNSGGKVLRDVASIFLNIMMFVMQALMYFLPLQTLFMNAQLTCWTSIVKLWA